MRGADHRRAHGLRVVQRRVGQGAVVQQDDELRAGYTARGVYDDEQARDATVVDPG